jgi:AcrR family transcriptional regulator
VSSQGPRTRTRLLDAGTQALADQGFHATRVDDVVRIAGVSHGTFYLYFANKDDLFRAMAGRCAEDVSALAASLGEVTPDEAGAAELRRWIAEFLGIYRRHGVVIRAWAESKSDDRALVRLGVSSFGRVTSEFSVRLVASGATDRQAELRSAALLAMLERFAFLVTNRDMGWTDDDALDTLSTLVHRGWFRS